MNVNDSPLVSFPVRHKRPTRDLIRHYDLERDDRDIPECLHADVTRDKGRREGRP